jgi:hypothetical protein
MQSQGCSRSPKARLCWQRYFLAIRNDYLPQLEKHRIKSRTKQADQQQKPNKQFPKKQTWKQATTQNGTLFGWDTTNKISFGLKLLCKSGPITETTEKLPNFQAIQGRKKTRTRGIVRNNFLKSDALVAAKIGIKGHWIGNRAANALQWSGKRWSKARQSV